MSETNEPLIVGPDMAQALICTWPELAAAMAELHLWNKGDVDDLHDVWMTGVPSPDYKVAIVGANFDERKPRVGDHMTHVVSPFILAKWIEKISAKRGFPYSSWQAFALTQGEVDLGF